MPGEFFTPESFHSVSASYDSYVDGTESSTPEPESGLGLSPRYWRPACSEEWVPVGPSEVLRTPDEWMRLRHPDLVIYDPDGWRGPNGRSFEDEITEAEFDRRLPCCTLMTRPWEGQRVTPTTVGVTDDSSNSSGLDPGDTRGA